MSLCGWHLIDFSFFVNVYFVFLLPAILDRIGCKQRCVSFINYASFVLFDFCFYYGVCYHHPLHNTSLTIFSFCSHFSFSHRIDFILFLGCPWFVRSQITSWLDAVYVFVFIEQRKANNQNIYFFFLQNAHALDIHLHSFLFWRFTQVTNRSKHTHTPRAL